ncbi:tetraspanin [Echinococcus multilocularis]|uniref:Tetraspanin n=1 Tax=Echinococcus multilocularis TaxID=6211 RepID=A0A068Y056_ECHMU|nr:tetraspanin [Echinococcus multilocularis]
MDKCISCSLKVILQILNGFLLVTFAFVAAFGILLKAVKDIVLRMQTEILNDFEGDAEDVRQFADFIYQYVDQIATVFIVVGLILVAVCVFGCVSACSKRNILLKIYAAILIVLLVVEVIAAAAAYSNPNRLANSFLLSTETLLMSYANDSVEGRRSTAVWNVLMTSVPHCCGMDGYEDFVKLKKSLPPPCCNITTGDCDQRKAQSANVTGCRDKIAASSMANLRASMYLSIVSILFLVALIIVTMLTIFANRAGKEEEVKGQI